MKKSKLLMPIAGITALAAVAPVVTMVGCNKNNDTKATFTVQFVTNGGSAVQSVTVKDGETIDAPADPVRLAYTFDGWYLDPDCTAEYDFTQPVKSNMILYANWVAQELYLSVPDQFTLNYGKATLTAGGTKDFYSTKTIHVYDEEGRQLDSRSLYFESDRPSVAMVDEDGVVTPAPLGEIADNYAYINVYLRGEQRPFAYTKVNVVKQTAAQSGITLETDNTITYQNYTHDTDGICIIPDSINIGTETNKVYPVYLGAAPTDPTAINGVTTLILPRSFGGINGASFTGKKLQNVLFGGTVEEYEETYAPWLQSAWMGDQVMFIQCVDGKCPLSGRHEAKLTLDETLGHIVMKTPEFSSEVTQGLFRFDYSKFGSDILASNRKSIAINNSTSSGTTLYSVWLNGYELTLGTHYTFTNNIITFDDTQVSLNASSNVVIKCTMTPESSKKVYLSCDVEWPNKITITKRAPSIFYVNEPFSIKGLEVTATNASGSLEYIVPTEYLQFYVKEGGVEKEIKPGYIFKDKDVARTKTVYVRDTISGLETNYTISVWKE